MKSENNANYERRLRLVRDLVKLFEEIKKQCNNKEERTRNGNKNCIR